MSHQYVLSCGFDGAKILYLVIACWGFSDRTRTRVRWGKHFPLELFRTFTEKMTRELNLLLMFNLPSQETVLIDRKRFFIRFTCTLTRLLAGTGGTRSAFHDTFSLYSCRAFEFEFDKRCLPVDSTAVPSYSLRLLALRNAVAAQSSRQSSQILPYSTYSRHWSVHVRRTSSILSLTCWSVYYPVGGSDL